MPWLRFLRDFDWEPPQRNGTLVVAYLAGMELFVPRACAAAAIGASKAKAIASPRRKFPTINKRERMTAPVIIMVGADKGGVGKTTVCRALLDYLAAHKIAPRVFDTQVPDGDLARFSPGASVVDVEKIEGQRAIFDRLDGVTVIDIRANSFASTLRMLDKVRLLDDVRSGAVTLALLHVLGPSIASLEEIGSASRTIGGGAKHFIVKNHVNETAYAIAKDPRYAQYFERMDAVIIDVPRLEADVAEGIQALGVSFIDFAKNPDQSRIDRGYVHGWLGAVWRDFDKVGLGDLAAGDLGEKPAS